MLVGVEAHADLLEYFLTLSERLDPLRELAREIAAAAETQERFTNSFEALRSQARNLLRPAPEETEPQGVVDPDERHEVWLCTSCGQVEAPRDCLGICVRRNGEFVRATDHDGLGARIESGRREARRLATLARQIGWTSPRPGQADTLRNAVRRSALALLEAV
jgi:hypothetical protein